MGIRNDDSNFNPVGGRPIPTDTAGGLFSFVAVKAYYLPGAETQRNGNDRFAEDMKDVAEIWGFTILPVPGPPEIITESQLGPDFTMPTNLNDLRSDNPSFRRLQQIHAEAFPSTTKVIAVWYIPFSTRTSGWIAAAYSNVGFPNPNSDTFYQHIVMTNRANASFNSSTLYHELGHIFYGTATVEDPVTGDPVAVEDDCDPTSPGCSDDHSPNDNNIMYSSAGTRMVLTTEQRQKAESTFLFL